MHPLEVAQRLRELRENKQWTQEHLSAVSGVGMKSISTFETGERTDTMKLAQLAALLAALDTTFAAFFCPDWKEAPPETPWPVPKRRTHFPVDPLRPFRRDDEHSSLRSCLSWNC